MAREEGAVGHTRDEVGIAGEVEVDIEEVIAVAVDTGATEVAEVGQHTEDDHEQATHNRRYSAGCGGGSLPLLSDQLLQGSGSQACAPKSGYISLN